MSTLEQVKVFDRRRFLRSATTLAAAGFMPSFFRGQGKAVRASVVDFGADLTGKKDSTAAVRKAIASLNRSGARLVFPAGKYLFLPADDEACLPFSGYEGIEIYANNAQLSFTGGSAGGSGAFSFSHCNDVAVHDMKIEWALDVASLPKSAAGEGKASEEKMSGFVLNRCEGVVLEDVWLQHVPGTGVTAANCRNVQLDGLAVARGKASTAESGDGFVLRNCHGDIHLHECTLEGMSGDAINIHQSFWRIRERLDERSVVIESSAGQTLDADELPAAKGFVQFSSPDTLQLLGEIQVASVMPNRQGATLTFMETLSPVILSGMLVCSTLDGPKVVMDHCRISRNLGYGAVLHRRVEVTNSHFEHCGRAAILLAADAQRLQGPVVQNVNIRTNTFVACNQGAVGDSRGTITIDTAQQRKEPVTPTAVVNSGVRIEGNVFKDSLPAIFAAGVDGLLIDSNTFERTVDRNMKSGEKEQARAVVLRNVAHSQIRANIASTPQTIQLVDCADTVSTDGNRMLTDEKS